MKRFTMIAVVLALTASMSWAGIPLRYATASQEVAMPPFLDSTDGDTEETGLTIAATDILIWKWGATTLLHKTSGGATHIRDGVYYCTFDANDTSVKGPMRVFVHMAGTLYNWDTFDVLDPNVWDSQFSTGEIPGIAHLINRFERALPQPEDGSEPNTVYLADANEINDHTDNALPTNFSLLKIDSNGVADANLVLWDSNDPGELATESDMETAAQTGAEAAITTYGLDGIPSTLGTPTDTDLATDIKNVASAVAVVNTAVGAIVSNTVADGTVTEGGTASTFTLSSDFVATDNAYPVGSLLMFTDAGSGKKYCGPIQSYSSGRVVVMQQALPVAPENGDVVVILPYVWDAEAIAAIQRKR